MEPRRPQALDAGLFLIVVAVPLAVTPFTSAPFADPKLLLLGVGGLLCWFGAAPIDARLAWAVAAWFAVAVVAAATGVDPLRSLTGYEGALTGLGMLAACGVLLAAGASLDRERIDRIAGWLVWTGLTVSVVTFVGRIVPSALDAIAPDLAFTGGTVGNPVFAAALVSAALAAALVRPMPTWRRVATIAVLVTGVSLGGERVAWLLPSIALVATCWRARIPLRRAVALGALIVGTLGTWAALEPVLPAGTTVSPVGQVSSLATDTGRFTAFSVHTRAWLDRPLVGWGPAATWSGFRATAEPAEIESAGPGWDEAHNILVQTASSSGVLGLAALALLIAVVFPRVLRSPRDALAWTFGGAVVLGSFSLFEPFNLTVTPLAFLLAGAAASVETATHGATASRGRGSHEPWRRPLRLVAGVILTASALLAATTFAASALEEWGRRYEEEWALRASLRIQPWRTTAAIERMQDLSLDARAGAPGADLEARTFIEDTVATRGWDPRVRPAAAEAAALMFDLAAARRYLGEQIGRFPGDVAILPDADDLQTATEGVPAG